MGLPRVLLSDRKVQAVLGCMGIAAALAVVLVWQSGMDARDLKGTWDQTLAWLTLHGQWFFLALVVLPGLPVPSSALFFTAGVVWRDQPLMACVLCWFATALNLTWTYWLAAGPGRKLVEAVLRRSSFRIPELPREDSLKWILILKLTPGIPFFIQNYICGFARVPFRLYLPVGLLCNGIIGAGIVLGGAGLGNGRIAPLLTGISVVALGVVLARWLRERLAKRKETAAGAVVE